MKRAQFTYTDGKGKATERDVVVYAFASDFDSAFDLSEYNKDERDYFEEQLLELHEQFLADIKELGLSSNYRRFKTKGIQNA